MERNAAFRRVFHILSPAFLAYYLIPETLADGITRTGVSILFVGTALCIEIARIALGIRLLGLRPYEGQRVSAYAQGLLGLAFGLFVIRDPRIVVPVFLGMAWIDPLAALSEERLVAGRPHGGVSGALPRHDPDHELVRPSERVALRPGRYRDGHVDGGTEVSADRRRFPPAGRPDDGAVLPRRGIRHRVRRVTLGLRAFRSARRSPECSRATRAPIRS